MRKEGDRILAFEYNPEHDTKTTHDGTLDKHIKYKSVNVCTLPKFNIAPEKWWLEDYFPFGMVYFQGLC